MVAEGDGRWLAGGPEVLSRSLGIWEGGDGEQSLLTHYWAGQKGWWALPTEGWPQGFSLSEVAATARGLQCLLLTTTCVGRAPTLSSMPRDLPFRQGSVCP